MRRTVSIVTELRTATAHRKTFEINTRGKEFVFPYSEFAPVPSRSDRVREVFGTVHVDHVLEYNKDPSVPFSKSC